MLTYKESKALFPLHSKHKLFIEEARSTIREILNGNDSRILLIVGPCSIHDQKSAKEFAILLKELQRKVRSQFFIVMRVYCEKPRTTSGWKGFLYDPLLDGSYEIKLGIQWTRQLLLDLSDFEIPIATEFLDPMTAFYYDDLVTWGSIGARSSSSQIHRQLASDLAMPIGFKNGVAGDISAAINGALAASYSHKYIRIDEDGEATITTTAGNPDSHVVLRGGESGPNYDKFSVSNTLLQLEKLNLPARLLVDCSHHNSFKQHTQQIQVFQSVIDQIKQGNHQIKGLMLESHLNEGNQELTSRKTTLKYGVSITDSCLDWYSTSELILAESERLQEELKTAHALP